MAEKEKTKKKIISDTESASGLKIAPVDQSVSRRRFLKCLSGAATSTLVLGACATKQQSDPSDEPEGPTILAPRTKKSNPFVNAQGRPLLVCVSGTDYKTMLAAGLARLGGLSKLISAAQDVVINPNCNAADPYPGISDAGFVVGIIDELKKVTSGTVSVADQGYESAGAVYAFSGMDPAVTQAGAELVIMNDTYQVKREGWPLNATDIKVYKHIYDAPVLISTCLIKRHHTATHTCTIKNNVGIVAGPGAISTRHYLHYEATNFSQALVEFAAASNPDLAIVDARTILTVGGPRFSDGVPVVVNKIILSGDIVSADLYCQRILAAHDNEFGAETGGGLTEYANSIGLGSNDLNSLEIHEITA